MLDSRIRYVYVVKVRDVVVVVLEVIILDDVGGLWEVLKEFGEVESVLGVLFEFYFVDDKYLKFLVEVY